MSIVYKIAKFGNNVEQNSDIKTPSKGPKMKTQQGKSDEIFKTDTEHRMDRLRQQLSNPITLDDLKSKEAFKNDTEKPTDSTGPKKKQMTLIRLYQRKTAFTRLTQKGEWKILGSN